MIILEIILNNKKYFMFILNVVWRGGKEVEWLLFEIILNNKTSGFLIYF